MKTSTAPSTRNCSLPFGEGIQTYQNGSWGACVITCSDQEHTENGACVSNIEACLISNGAGVRNYDTNLNTWSDCQIRSCHTGFYQSGNTCVPSQLTFNSLSVNEEASLTQSPLISWSTTIDSNYNFSNYLLTLGTSAGAKDIDETTITQMNHTSYQFTELSLQERTTYHITITATSEENETTVQAVSLSIIMKFP